MQDAENLGDNSQKTLLDDSHCNCFLLVSDEDEIKLFNGLKSIGAYDQRFEQPHGQKWGLTYTLDDYWQLHVKMMSDRHIECEIEARIILAEHQTIKSKPAHYEMRQLLAKFGISPVFITPIPEPCSNRLLITPDNPTDITRIGIFLALCAVAIFVSVLTMYVIKRMKETRS